MNGCHFTTPQWFDWYAKSDSLNYIKCQRLLVNCIALVPRIRSHWTIVNLSELRVFQSANLNTAGLPPILGLAAEISATRIYLGENPMDGSGNLESQVRIIRLVQDIGQVSPPEMAMDYDMHLIVTCRIETRTHRCEISTSRF